MMKEIVDERDDLLKANQILQALIGNRDKEVDRLRAALKDIVFWSVDPTTRDTARKALDAVGGSEHRWSHDVSKSTSD